MKTIEKIKNNIKICLLAHRIRREKSKTDDARAALIERNNVLHNGRMEIDETLQRLERDRDKKIYRYKREIIKGLQK